MVILHPPSAVAPHTEADHAIEDERQDAGLTQSKNSHSEQALLAYAHSLRLMWSVQGFRVGVAEFWMEPAELRLQM